MTLDEAINHCEEKAEEKEREAEYRQETQGDMFKFLDDLSKSVGGEGVENDALNECLECAAEHRQLAEWLKELKLYREILIDRPCEVCEFHKAGSCSRWTCVLEGVNADDNIQS